MKKKELKGLLELRETQLLNAVGALERAEWLLNNGSPVMIRNYPIVKRDGWGDERGGVTTMSIFTYLYTKTASELIQTLVVFNWCI